MEWIELWAKIQVIGMLVGVSIIVGVVLILGLDLAINCIRSWWRHRRRR